MISFCTLKTKCIIYFPYCFLFGFISPVWYQNEKEWRFIKQKCWSKFTFCRNNFNIEQKLKIFLPSIKSVVMNNLHSIGFLKHHLIFIILLFRSTCRPTENHPPLCPEQGKTNDLQLSFLVSCLSVLFKGGSGRRSLYSGLVNASSCICRRDGNSRFNFSLIWLEFSIHREGYGTTVQTLFFTWPCMV